jgi:hypothetical protein
VAVVFAGSIGDAFGRRRCRLGAFTDRRDMFDEFA